MNKHHINSAPWELIGKSLSGNISKEEHNQLIIWQNVSVENKKLFDEVSLIWDESQSNNNKTALTKDQTEAAWKKLAQSIKTNKVKKIAVYRSLPILAAASVIALLFLGYWMMPQIFGINSEVRSKWLAVSNETSEPKIVQMPDGSSIVLNKNSTLRYPENFELRKVELIGEAFFKVAYNPKKPFIVELGESKVEVLGTSFNVSRSAIKSDISIMVESGKVNFITPGNEPVLLQSGKGAVYSGSKLFLKNNINASAWKNKYFKFQNSPVREIISSINDVYGTQIKVTNNKLLDCEFNGVFDNVEPEYILHAVSFGLGAELSFENNVYIMKGGGCN